jgi:START domain
MFSNVFGSGSQWKHDDLPTPTTKKEYQKLATSVLSKRRELIDTHGWTMVHDAEDLDDVIIEKKEIGNSGIATIRVTGFIKLEGGKIIDDLAKEIFDPTEKLQKRIYESVTEYKRVRKVSSKIVVGRTVAQASGITNREFLAMRTIESTSNGYLIGIQSINDEDHPHDSSCVRGTFKNGIELTPVMDGVVQVRTVDHIDPKGWVPGMLINSFIGTAGNWIKRF